MVIEISSLAGVMARVYAEAAGLGADVADALFEAVLPRSAGDQLPATPPGVLLATADRLDLLAALFAVGAQPTGSADPYGVRRAALGVLSTLMAAPPAIADALDLADGIAAARRQLPVVADEAVDVEVATFLQRRLEQLLVDDGHRRDLVRAVLPQWHHPARARDRLDELEQLTGTERFEAVAAAYKRVARILRSVGDVEGSVDPALFADDAERDLAAAVDAVGAPDPGESLPAFLERFAPLVDPINRFFDDVMVMADDEAVRTNRLALLGSIRAQGAGLVDWTEIADL
jgi:glycyl-tRNA synthetase